MHKALVGLAAAALMWTGCDRSEKQQDPTVTDYQRRSTEALERAQEAQERAREEHQQALDAREDVAKAEQEVREAQQALEERRARAQKELEEARQAQLAARQHTESAQKEAAQAQQRAMDLQQQQQQQIANAGNAEAAGAELHGRVEGSTSDSLVVRTEDGSRITLSLTPEVPVIVDGRRANLAQIPEGAEVRASFDPAGGPNEVSRVEVQTAGR